MTFDVFNDDDWARRRRAASEMARGLAPDVVTGLLRALREEHRNINVLNSALRVLTDSDVDVTSALLEFLTDDDSELRMYAALALGDLGQRGAVQGLIPLLQDADVNVRFHAIEALAKIGAPEAADDLLRVAHSGDFFLAFPAIDALAQLQDPGIAVRLTPLLQDDLIRISVVDALGRLGDDQVISPLVQLLASPGPHVVPVARALVTIHERYDRKFGEGDHIADLARRSMPVGAAQLLLETLDATDAEGLRSVVMLVSWMENPEIVAALTRLLGSEGVRREVVEALVRHGRDVTDALIARLDDDDLEIRRAAIVALGRIGDPSAVPALIRTLGQDESLSIPAAGALSRIGDSRAYSALISLLGHRNVSVRQAAMGAVNSLGDARTEADMARMIRDPNPNTRESAIRIAGYFGYATCAALVIAATADPNENVRRGAIESLPYFENEGVLSVLLRALQDEAPRIRASAAQALAQVDGPAVVQALVAALGDADAWVRYYAARSLGRLASSDAVDPLGATATSDSATHVRIACVEALSAIGGTHAAETLRSLLSSVEGDLVAAAARGLGRIGRPDALPPLLEMARSEDRHRRLCAVRALGTPEREVIRLLEWLAEEDPDSEVCYAAIDQLGSIASPQAVRSLIRLTGDERLRERSVAVLTRLDSEKIDLLGNGLQDPCVEVRRAVVDALGRKKHPKASQMLAAALEDQEPLVREAGVLALARLGSHSAERKLAMLISTDPNENVRRAAEKALKR